MGCIALQATEDPTSDTSTCGSISRVASSAVIAKRPVPTYAIQLHQISKWESFSERTWRTVLIERLRLDFYLALAGVKIGGKGEAAHEARPVDVRSLLP